MRIYKLFTGIMYKFDTRFFKLEIRFITAYEVVWLLLRT